MPLPRLLNVIQNFPDRRRKDIPGAVRLELEKAGFAARVRPGASIAIGVGSRGIANIATIVKAVVDYWKAAGCQPFIFPAMGSHGAASAEGQADVLAHYGIIAETMGCPVHSSLETVAAGTTPEGIEAHLDRYAAASDGVMLVGRIKWHTDFEGKLESGLFKMMAIGLGKWSGAAAYHSHAYTLGLEQTIRSIGRQILATGKIVGGLAILEDAHHNTAELHAISADSMEAREEQLLEQVKSWMPRIPVDLDLLIVDEIGKDISGSGMDSKMVNRGVNGHYNPWSAAPRISRIFVRDLSRNTYGNGTGVGMADVVNDRLVSKIDMNAMYINTLTSLSPACARIPIHFATDRECVERLGKTCGKQNASELRIGRIRNTLELSPMVLSENLRGEMEPNPLLRIVGDAYDFEFDQAGNLPPLEELFDVLSEHVDFDVQPVTGPAR